MALANPIRGQVEITIGGQARTMRLDYNALCVLERRMGKPAPKLFDQDSMGLDIIRETMFVALAHEDSRLTPERVGDWIGSEPWRLSEFGKAVAECLTLAMPRQKADDANNVERPTGPAGSA